MYAVFRRRCCTGCCTSKRCTATFDASREGALSIPGNSFPHGRMLVSKMPGSCAISAIGFPLVSRVQQTLAFTILGRGLLDFLHDQCSPLSEYILNFHYSSKLGQSSPKNGTSITCQAWILAQGTKALVRPRIAGRSSGKCRNKTVTILLLAIHFRPVRV